MLDSSGHEIALVVRQETREHPVIADEVDHGVFEARWPLKSRKQAWLGLAGLFAATILIGWAIDFFLDSPTGAVATRVVASAPPTARPVPSPSTSPRPSPRVMQVQVISPDLLGSRPRSTESTPQAPDHLRTLVDGVVVTGVYGELDARDFTFISAATSPYLLYPDQEIDVLIGLLQVEDPNLVDLTPVPAGDLGGVARCGQSKFSDLGKVVCVWAADQSVGIITWIDQPYGAAQEEFLALRGQIEKAIFA